MSEILIAALSPTGHVGPMLSIAQDLVARGNHVTMMTGAIHAASVRAVGAELHPLPPVADLDDSLFRSSTRGITARIDALNLAITRMFVQPMRHQAAELSAAMARTRFDAMIVDYGFFGVIPLLLGDPAHRPPVLYYTPTPLMLSSRDTAPSGFGLPPHPGRSGQLRNWALNLLSQHVILRQSQHAVNAKLKEIGAPPLPTFLLDIGVLADRFMVPTVPSFEYPRSDLAPNVRFVGRVHPRATRQFERPHWWPELDGDRPVVHVTQGTVDNEDLRRLVEPAIEALGRDDVTVVATTGGRAVHDITIPLPANTRVAEYIPHDVLLPKVDVMITNGGYGAVQRAVATGVPVIVAGNTEDKPEVAARVAWSGAGLDLKTGTPSAEVLRGAVHRVLGDGRYLCRARALETDFARRDGIAEIAALVDEVIGGNRVPSRLRNGDDGSWRA